jgi:hypothetical protein
MATNAAQRDHLGRLPAELKCAVVRSLSALKDRQALSLLNKEWAVVVMPIMWETFTTDLNAKKGQRDVLGLAHPDSNIIKHVRRIHLFKSLDATKCDNLLPRLLTAIPRDQLRGFKSKISVPIDSLELLVQLHTRLEKLDLIGIDILVILQSPWTGRSLSELTSIKIPVGTLESRAVGDLWTNCTKLKHVCLVRNYGGTSTRPNLQEHFFDPDASIAVQQSGAPPVDNLDKARLQLNSLYIDDLVLPLTFTTMFQQIDIISLQVLVLDETQGVAEILEAMCSEFQRQQPSLRRLRLIGMSGLDSDDFTSHLQLFLLSFHGLRQLHVHCDNCIKIDVDGIINHGETLTDLLLVNGVKLSSLNVNLSS